MGIFAIRPSKCRFFGRLEGFLWIIGPFSPAGSFRNERAGKPGAQCFYRKTRLSDSNLGTCLSQFGFQVSAVALSHLLSKASGAIPRVFCFFQTQTGQFFHDLNNGPAFGSTALQDHVEDVFSSAAAAPSPPPAAALQLQRQLVQYRIRFQYFGQFLNFFNGPG